MKKLNLVELSIRDMDGKEYDKANVAKDLATGIYNKMRGLPARSVALALYKATGEIEVNEEEFNVVTMAIESFGTPALIDAFYAQNAELNKEEPNKK